MRLKLFPFVAPCAGFVFALCSLPAASLHLLPAFGDGALDYALSLADDGTAIGYSQDLEASTPVLWRPGESFYAAAHALPLPASAVGGGLRWISADASLLAGFAAKSVPEESEADYAPTIWTRSPSGGYSPSMLPRLGGGFSESVITSGSTAGTRFVGQSGSPPVAVVWRGSPSSSYSVQALALPSDARDASQATSMSSDGVRAVGHYETATGSQAVAWTENSGVYTVLKLQGLAPGAQSFAEVISRDGTLAGGAAHNADGLRPVMWNTTTAVVTVLETLPGFEATVLGIAENNVWLGGRATDSETFESTAVLWNGDGRIFDLVALAADAGISFFDLTPESVTGVHLVSTGSYTIVGTGVTSSGATQGFVLENLALATPISQPEPPVVHPDPEPAPTLVSKRRQPAASSLSESKTWGRTEEAERRFGGGGSRPRSR